MHGQWELLSGLRTSIGFVAAAVAVTLLAGCGSLTPTAAASSTPTAASTITGHNTTLIDYSDNDLAQSKVILTGAIGDFGEATSINADGSVNPDHNVYLSLALSHGSFRLDIAALDQKIVNAFSALKPNADTCSASVSVSGNVPVVDGSGTGVYAGIIGSFDLTVMSDEVVPQSDCSLSAAFLSQAIIMDGYGNVSIN